MLGDAHGKFIALMFEGIDGIINMHVAESEVSLQARNENSMRRRFSRFRTKFSYSWIGDGNLIEEGQIGVGVAPGSFDRASGIGGNSVTARFARNLVSHLRNQNFQGFPRSVSFRLFLTASESTPVFHVVDTDYRGIGRCSIL